MCVQTRLRHRVLRVIPPRVFLLVVESRRYEMVQVELALRCFVRAR